MKKIKTINEVIAELELLHNGEVSTSTKKALDNEQRERTLRLLSIGEDNDSIVARKSRGMEFENHTMQQINKYKVYGEIDNAVMSELLTLTSIRTRKLTGYKFVTDLNNKFTNKVNSFLDKGMIAVFDSRYFIFQKCVD